MEKKRQIGKSDLYTPPFVLGGNTFGWTADEKTSFEILDKYVAAGFNFIDTANTYSNWVEGNTGGDSEKIIGKWLKKTGNRNKVLIATKVGALFSDTKKGLKKKYILEAAEDSLKRLNTDHIDLYFSHYDDPSTPIEETLEAYQQLIQEGKVRYIAASNFSGARLKEAMEISAKNNLPAYVCLQPEYNLYDRQSYEADLEPIVNEYGLGVVSYFSLASGFLTGKYNSEIETKGVKREGMLKGEYFGERGKRILKKLDEIAKEYNATCAQIALAWLQSRPSITAPIASVSKISQMDILKSVEINLSNSALTKLNDASAY